MDDAKRRPRGKRLPDRIRAQPGRATQGRKKLIAKSKDPPTGGKKKDSLAILIARSEMLGCCSGLNGRLPMSHGPLREREPSSLMNSLINGGNLSIPGSKPSRRGGDKTPAPLRLLRRLQENQNPPVERGRPGGTEGKKTGSSRLETRQDESTIPDYKRKSGGR